MACNNAEGNISSRESQGDLFQLAHYAAILVDEKFCCGRGLLFRSQESRLLRGSENSLR